MSALHDQPASAATSGPAPRHPAAATDRPVAPSSGAGAPALLLVAHGTRSEAGRAETEALCDAVAALAPGRDVRLGYLELCDPPAGRVLDDLAAAGTTEVVAVPLMLHTAGHAKSDVPAVVLAARAEHPAMAVRYARPLGVDHALVALARRRLEEAGALGLPVAVLARGTSDPDANAEAYRVSRLVADVAATTTVTTGFSGLTWPSVPEALAQLRSLGAGGRVAAFAWFLATGVLVERMRDQYAEFAAATGIEVVDAGHLGPDPAVAALVLERAAEAAAGEGTPPTTCDTCLHRRPWPGLEDRVGAPRGEGHSHLAAEHRGAHTH